MANKKSSKTTSKPKWKDKDGKQKVIPNELLPDQYWEEITTEFYLFIVRELLINEVIQKCDYPSVRLLGDTYNTYAIARQSIRNNGLVYKTISTKGEPIMKANPSQKILQDTLVQLQKLLDSLGLNPKARGDFKEKNPDSNLPPPKITKWLN
jgi:P27 family predicted phage terminase small subunit